ncbi:MAG: enoyl-CoA hydratase-related protein [Gemmobacter sp.]
MQQTRNGAPAFVTIEGQVACITLDRPDQLNPINPEMATTLARLAREVEQRSDVRVLVIRGSGRAFCAGGDIGAFAANLDDMAPLVNDILDGHHAFLTTLRRMPQFVLTSIHGAAAGAGLSLAFMGDMVIAADTARFTPAYHRLGVSPDGGGTVGLVQAVGPRRALQIYLAEDGFSAAQAAEWGLVGKVVPADTLEAETRALADRIAGTPLEAIAATKHLVYRSDMALLSGQLDAEREALLACMRQPFFKAAVRKFVGS